MIEWNAILNLINTSEIRTFFLSYAATNRLDSLLNYAKSKLAETSIAYMFIDALNEAMCNICDRYNMEQDHNAISDTFSIMLSNLSNDVSKSGLSKILANAIGVQPTEAVLNDWITQFDIAITKPGREWLFRYAQQRDKREQAERLSSGMFFVFDPSLTNIHINHKYDRAKTYEQFSDKKMFRFKEYKGSERIVYVDNNIVFLKLYKLALGADDYFFYSLAMNYDPMDKYIIQTAFKQAIHDTSKAIVEKVQERDISRSLNQFLRLGLMQLDQTNNLHVTEDGIEFFDYLITKLPASEDVSENDSSRSFVEEVQEHDIIRCLNHFFRLRLIHLDKCNNLHITEDGIEYFNYLISKFPAQEDSEEDILV